MGIVRGAQQVMGALFDIGKDILRTELDAVTKVIRCQLGDSTNGVVDADKAEWWQQPGFWSKPSAAATNGPSAQAIVLHDTSRDIVIAARDVRNTAVYGNLKDGETCVGASTGQARTLYKNNGAIVHYTTANNAAGGSSVQAYIGPDKIQLLNTNGGITIDANGITLTSGKAALTLTPAGVASLGGTQVQVAGSLTAVSGSVATCIGPNAAPTPGVPSVGSAIHGVGGSAGAGSTNVFISP